MMLSYIFVFSVAIVTTQGSEWLERNRYSREINLHTDDKSRDELSRPKRQVLSYSDVFYVTQCSHDNIEPTQVPSIEVKGVNLQYPDATIKAAKLIHLMTRFMPKKIFHRLSENSSVGLFSAQVLPGNVFDEFILYMPIECAANCRVVRLGDGEDYDCSQWCTSVNYPYNPGYPLNYLWSYGNFSRTFVVETNVVCQGFNPSGGAENYLVREFGLAIMARGLDEATVQDINTTYDTALSNNTWSGLINVYDYFMRATQAWFNAATLSVDLGGMACINMFGDDGRRLCDDAFTQRKYLKSQDPLMYNILNHVYNNNRAYAEGAISTCDW